MTKYLFFDIDGTLTDSDHGEQWPSQSTLDALKQAQENGHKCLICSGRHYAGLHQYDALDMDGIVFSDGGGVVLRDGEMILTPIPDELVAKLIREVPDRYHGELILSSVHHMYASAQEYRYMSEVVRQISEADGVDMSVSMKKMGLLPLSEYSGEAVLEIDVGFPSQETEDVFAAELDPGLDFISTTASYGRDERTSGEVTAKGVNKGTGIEKAVRYMDGSMQDTYGFGDSMNDASMIKACAAGIAMGNAVDELKQLADYVTGDIRDDGLADAMRHFGLI